jgi:aspartokinase/homoserine dehydrogenase
MTGFIGKSVSTGSITTLGRNGSDYSAALISAAIGAEKLIINTDVPGVFTADPRIVTDAFPVPEMRYNEAIELSRYGSKIFHPKTMQPLMERGIPMVIRNTSDKPDAAATVIGAETAITSKESPNLRPRVGSRRTSILRSMSEMQLLDAFSEEDGKLQGSNSNGNLAGDDAPPSPSKKQQIGTAAKRNTTKGAGGAVCVASLENLSLLTIRAINTASGAENTASRTLRALDQTGLEAIWSDQRSGSDCMILLKKSDRSAAAKAVCEEFKSEKLLEMSATEPLTLLSLVPKHNTSRVQAASRFYEALAKAGVKIHNSMSAAGVSTPSVSCLIDAEETPLAVKTVHNAFNFSRKVLSLFIIGRTRIMKGFLEDLKRKQKQLQRVLNLDLRVCAVLSGSSFFNAKGGSGGNNEDFSPREAVCSEGYSIDKVLQWLTDADQSVGDHAFAAMQAPNLREQYEVVRQLGLQSLLRLPVPIIVDCTSVPGNAPASTNIALEECYRQVMQAGVRIVTTSSDVINRFADVMAQSGQQIANMSPNVNAAEAPEAKELHFCRQGFLRFDSCISSKLPLLSTIRGLLQAGQSVCTVEVSFSATIGYMMDRIGRKGRSLREAAEDAREQGYPEPRFWADLSGHDMLQKMRLVAFALGCELPEDATQCPEFFPGIPDTAEDAEVYAFLDDYDEKTSFSKKVQSGYEAGRRVRFIATLDVRVGSRSASVSFKKEDVESDHWAHQLQKNEIAAALFQSEALRPNTLVAEVNSNGVKKTDTTLPMLVLRAPGAGRVQGEAALSDLVRMVTSGA